MQWPQWRLVLAGALAAALALAMAGSFRVPAGAVVEQVPLVSPVEPMRAVNLARLPVHDWLPGHRGIDLAAQVDQAVVAPGDGVVVFAGDVVDRPVVTIRHGDGALSSVEPVAPRVDAGDPVRAGQQIGSVSAHRGHCDARTCVHWGVRRDGRYVDPLDVLEGYGPVVLLPRQRAAQLRRTRRSSPATLAAS